MNISLETAKIKKRIRKLKRSKATLSEQVPGEKIILDRLKRTIRKMKKLIGD